MRNNLQKGVFSNWRSDLPSGLVVFLVALPLCLGIALASGAPLFSGLITGFVGGIVVASVSRSALSVSGPAAGLTAIVLAALDDLGRYEIFLLAVVLAGSIQIILGFLKAGLIGNFFPSSVIRGMLAAIGLILILKQIPHAFGYDVDPEGELSFVQSDGRNTFSEIFYALNYISLGSLMVSSVSLILLIFWESSWIQKKQNIKMIPAPLIVVLLGIGMNEIFKSGFPELVITTEHLVSLPVADDFSSFITFFTTPDFSQILNPDVYIVAITIAIVASLETLLSIDAVDKLDPYKRITPLNRELKAQGIGNLLAGMLGGLPLTSVIVRSSANVSSGGKTKLSAIFHGFLLLLTVAFIPGLLNLIPLSALAAILLVIGYKLTKPVLFIEAYKKGYDQLVPFVITILAILFSNLLVGIIIGIVVGLFFVLRTNFHKAVFTVHDNGNYLIRLTKDVSFLNKAVLRKTLESIPDNSYVIIDGSRSTFIDNDIVETLEDFVSTSENRNIKVELKQSIAAAHPLFKGYNA